MKFAITILVGVLAAAGSSIDSKAAHTEHPPGMSLYWNEILRCLLTTSDPIQPDLSDYDVLNPKSKCDESEVTHVHVIQDSTVKTSVTCNHDASKRDISILNTTATDALADKFNDPRIETTSQDNADVTPFISPATASSGIASRDVTGYYVQLRWGGKMQHAGEFGQGDLRDRIKEKLDFMCPDGQTGHKVCGDDDRMEKIGPVGWDKKGQWVYGDAHLQIRPKLVYLPKNYDGLRELFVSLPRAFKGSGWS